MGVHAQFAGDHVEHLAIGVDDEGGALDRHQLAQQSSFDAELRGDRAVGVGQQRVVETLRLGELGLLCNGINTDADPVGPDRGEFAGEVAEVAGFLGAAGCHRGRVEEKPYRPVGQQGAELARGASLVGKLEVSHGVTGFHGGYVTPGVAAVTGKMAWKIEGWTPTSPPPPRRGMISARWRPSTAWCL